MPPPDIAPRKWRVHPKLIGLLVAALSLSILAVSTMAMPPDVTSSPSFSILLTIFGFLAGSGFTTWLSMTIYEYIREQEQRRAWKHEFAIEKVRQIYGPIYDEMIRNRDALMEMGEVTWEDGQALERRHLSLLVPGSLLRRGKEYGRLTREYDDHRREVQLEPVVLKVTTDYVSAHAGPHDAMDSVVGGEGQYVLGASNPAYKANYERLLRRVETALTQAGEGSVAEFEDQLRKAILAQPRAQGLLSIRDRLLTLTSEFLSELEPLIRDPYEN